MQTENRVHIYDREIMAIAIPAMLEAFMTTLSSIIDSKMVSSLGTIAISAVAVTNQPKLFVFTFFFAMNTVLSSKVAFYRGQNNQKKANEHFVTALTVIAVGSVVLGLLSIAAARPILLLCSGQADTMDMSVTYFRIIMGGMIFNHLFCGINAGLRGCGYTKVTLFSNIVFAITNICFNYLLIGGNLGFPRLEIAGAALATVIGTVAALIFSVIYSLRSSAFLSLKFCRLNSVLPSKSSLFELFSMAKHVIAENILTRIGFLLTSSIAARAGSFAMSLYAIGMHLLNLDYAIGNGFQVSAVALIGRSKGENRYDKVAIYARKIHRKSFIFSFVFVALLLLFAQYYFGFFSSEADFIEVGTYSAFVIAAIIPTQITKIIYSGILQGLGEMKRVMRASVIAVTGVQVVCNIVLILILDLGIWGIWIGVFISQLTWLILLRREYRSVSKNLPDYRH